MNTAVSPPTLVSSALIDATAYANEIEMVVSSTCIWHNNNAVPFWLDTYVMTPKGSTNDTATVLYISGAGKSGAWDVSSNFAYPSMSTDLTTVWKFAKHKRLILQPGQICSLSYKKRFKFSPSTFATNSDTWQDRYASHTYVSRIEGLLGHDNTTSTDLGTSKASADWKIDYKVRVTYGAGTKFEDMSFNTSEQGTQVATVIGWPTNAENTSSKNTL